MKKQTLSLGLFWIGLAIAIAFTLVGTWSLMGTLRNLSMQEVGATMWDLDGPLFYLWAFAVPLGSVLAGIAAFMYARSKPIFAWLTGIGVLGVVLGDAHDRQCTWQHIAAERVGPTRAWHGALVFPWRRGGGQHRCDVCRRVLAAST